MKNMKMRVLGMLILLVSAGFVFMGCLTTSSAYVYNDSVPIEQSSTIKIVECFVTKFNESDTTADWRNWGSAVGTKLVQIPSGSHTLELLQRDEKSFTGFNDTTITTRKATVELGYNFLPGHSYFITAQFDRRSNKVLSMIIDETSLDNKIIPNTESENSTPLEGIWRKNDKEYLIFAGNEVMGVTKIANFEYLEYGYFDFTNSNVIVNYVFAFNGKKWKVQPFSFTYKIEGTTLISTGGIGGGKLTKE